MIKVKCSFCKKIIKIFPYKLKYQKNIYCNRVCMGKYYSRFYSGKNSISYKGKIKVKCECCDKTLYIYPHLYKKYNHHFCNLICSSKILRGKKHHCFVNGESVRGYITKFNNKQKEKIRKRDKYKCKLCGLNQRIHILLYKCKLIVHHIDYDKSHADIKRLISLCNKCNTKVNFNRDYYFALFSYVLGNIYNEGE